jgi:hypothetical protein
MAIKIEGVTARVNRSLEVEEVILSCESPRFSLPLYFTDEKERGQYENGATYRLDLVKVEKAPPEPEPTPAKTSSK